MSKRVAKYLTAQMRLEEMKAYYTDRRLFQSTRSHGQAGLTTEGGGPTCMSVEEMPSA